MAGHGTMPPRPLGTINAVNQTVMPLVIAHTGGEMGRPKLFLRSLLLVILFLFPVAVSAVDSGGSAAPKGLELLLGADVGKGPIAVGVFFNSREAGSMEVLLDADRFLIPLERFAALAGARIESDKDKTVFVTPIGRVDLVKDDLRDIAGLAYITQTAIELKLATQVVFEQREYALRFDLPWRGALAEKEGIGEGAPKPVPDARPPSASLSSFRSDGLFRRINGENSSFSSTILGGRLGNGWWRARYQDTSEGSREIREYAWVTTRKRNIFLTGQQLVQVHPLLAAFELTGMQLGWTNQPLDLFARSGQVSELLPRGFRPQSSFSGPGPIGGVAELRIDGNVVAREAIGLSGTYEFVDIPLPVRQVGRVEVYVFDRHNLEVPVAIHDRSRSVSEYLLPKGAIVRYGGGGYYGNLLNDIMHSERGSDYAGFFQWRQGITDHVTIESAAQSTPGGTQGMVGVVTSIGRYLVSSMSVAASPHGSAYDLTIDGLPRPWRFSARSQVLGKGYVREDHQGSYDHFVELDYGPKASFEIGLVGRSYKTSGIQNDFILPTLYWQPKSNLTLRARPDYQGDYNYELFWVFRSTARVAISVRDRTYGDLSVWVFRNTQLLVGGETGGKQPGRGYLGVQWSGFARNAPTLFAQFSRSQGSWGYRVNGRAAIVPGLMGSIDYRDEPSIDFPKRRSRSLFVGLNADLALAGGRLLPAYTVVSLGMNGSMAGKILIEVEGKLKAVEVAGVSILLDGRSAAKTERNGSFFIGNLKDGLYVVVLDTEKLPVDLRPVSSQLIVEVAAGAVTRVDFKVVREFGIAGRVVDATGKPIVGLEVELFDGSGTPTATGSTDNFGYYRLDGIRTGVYRLRIKAGQVRGQAEPPPERLIQIKDDFLFDQDLVVPAASIAPNVPPDTPPL